VLSCERWANLTFLRGLAIFGERERGEERRRDQSRGGMMKILFHKPTPKIANVVTTSKTGRGKGLAEVAEEQLRYDSGIDTVPVLEALKMKA